jgi:hypothetical protein
MSVIARLALFVAGLGVVFVAAFGLGRAVGPDEATPTTTVPVAPTVTTEMPADHDLEMGS